MKTSLTLIYIALAAILTTAGCRQDRLPAGATVAAPTDTLPLLITQVRECSRLYTAEFHVHKIVTHDDVLRLKGSILRQDINVRLPLGDRKIAIPMDATLKAYIDFSDFSEKNIERHDGKLTIVLPDPKVEMTSSKINQKEIHEYVGLTRSHFSDQEMTLYEQQGREAILQSIPQLGIIDMAQSGAARTLIPMMEQLGYREQDVTIAFRKHYGAQDIRSLLDLSTIEK